MRDCEEIFFASVHGAEEFYFPETAQQLQLEPRLVNVPLPRGAPAADYVKAFDDHVVCRAARRKGRGGACLHHADL